jgi:hypothetical protein
MLGIAREEHVILIVPTPSSPLYPEFDAVIFSGYDEANVNRSATLLSLEYLQYTNKSLNILSREDIAIYGINGSGNTQALNILSYKDRRIYEATGSGNRPALRIKQAMI